MRRYDEPIEVRQGLIGTLEGPAQFLWRRRLWRVTEVQTRWVETADWWNSPLIQAARGDLDDAAAGRDLLAEEEVWRVVAAPGRAGEAGAYELAHAWTDGAWRLRRVVD
ncbi:MAG: hypothetical protein IPL43_09460 [Micropruina sp.]|nr:hypothetical protein [Micropruina sp.]